MAKDKFNKWIRSIADMRGWDVNEMLNDPTYNYRHFLMLNLK